MPLAFADTSKKQRFEDGDVWIELRTELTKHDSDVLAEFQQNYRIDAALFAGDPEADRQVELRARLVEANRTMFSLLALSWSLGKDKPSSDDYDRLDVDSGAWIDRCVSEVIAGHRKRAEGNARTPRRRSGSRGS
jgi:Flp pilus assembly secretin CpaC